MRIKRLRWPDVLLAGSQMTLQENCMVDTGFDEDVFVAGYDTLARALKASFLFK